MSINVKKLKILLSVFQKELLKFIKGTVLGIYIVDDKGLILDTLVDDPKKSIDEDVIGVFSDVLKPTFLKMLKEFSPDHKGIFTFDTHNYKFIFCLAGAEYTFVVVCDPEIILGPILENVDITGKKISQIIAGKDIIPLLPSTVESDFVDQYKNIIPSRIDNLFHQIKAFTDDLQFAIHDKEQLENDLNTEGLTSSQKLERMIIIIKNINKRFKKIKLIK